MNVPETAKDAKMKKLTASDPDTQSADILAGNIEQLKALFPEAFTEGKVDFEVSGAERFGHAGNCNRWR